MITRLLALTIITTVFARAETQSTKVPSPAINAATTHQPVGAAADEFEKIAKQAETNNKLANASKLPETLLPWDAEPATPFAPGKKITNQKQLDAELQRMREKYAPFMADLAPSLPKRAALELESFDWRYGEGEDALNPAGAAIGQGNWTKVKIPHYWGPQGPSTTYYRTEVDLDEKMLSQDTLFAHFNGVDYIGDVYVNGTHVGTHTGLFDAFEFDIKPLVKPGKNVILVRVKNDNITFVYTKYKGPSGSKIAAVGGPGWDEPEKGWICCPAGSGLWQRAWLEARSATFINDIFVRPLANLRDAEVWVEVPKTPDDAPVTLEYSLYGQNFQAVVAQNQRAATIAPTEAAHGMALHKFTLTIPEAQLRLWTPEEPWLYQLQVRVSRNGKVVDASKKQFGMRTFSQSLTSTPKGRFYLNGSEIRLRGANTMGNLLRCVMTKNFAQLRDDILLGKIAHMNFWRLTQQPGQEEIYDYFDRLGMMAQTDLPNFASFHPDMIPEEHRQVAAMTRMVRGHPCNAVITYLNEPGPDRVTAPKLNAKELGELFAKFDPEVLAINPDQVIKWVEGDFLHINLGYTDEHWYGVWYASRKHLNMVYLGAPLVSKPDWMYSCGEYGAEALDSVALMKKHYPASWLKETPDGRWNPGQIPQSQSARTGVSWYGGVPGKGTMVDWVNTSRDHQKWGVRLMCEAFRRDIRLNSTAIHLLIDAWPAGWMKSIVDFERQAKPAYFEFREAQTPLAVNLRPNHFHADGGQAFRCGAWICNDTRHTSPGATLRYQVEVGGKAVMTGAVPARITACEPTFQGYLHFTTPQTNIRQPMTLRAGLFDASGKLLHDSSYEIDLIPVTQKDQKIPRKGGRPGLILGR